MKEIIWIYGTSASGKETFIKSLMKNRDLQKSLGLDSHSLAISGESLKNLGNLSESRASIVDEVANLLKTKDAVIIKWQYGDTLLDSPNILHDKFPHLKHTIIKLNVDQLEQVRRLKTKSWWHDEGKESEFTTKESLLVGESIKKLNSGFNIVSYDW